MATGELDEPDDVLRGRGRGGNINLNPESHPEGRGNTPGRFMVEQP